MEKLSTKQFKARKKVLEDLRDEKDEPRRMRRHEKIIWKIRGTVGILEYWLIAFALPIAILIWLISGDFWKGLGFWFVTQVYVVSGNLRGLTLHVENIIEWMLKKTI